MEYPIVITRLSDEDGGGYLAYAVDLPGCMSDGETPEEAAKNIQDAILEWIDAVKEDGKEVPLPGSAARAARARTDALVKAWRETAKRFDEFDERISNLELIMADLADRIENEQAWGRFTVLIGVSKDDAAPSRTLLIS